MKITFTAKPMRMEARTKDALLTKIKARFNALSVVMGSDGTYHKTTSGDRVVFRLEKRREKFTQVRNAHNKYKKSVKVRDAHWAADVYVFTKDFPMTVHQHLRCFSVRPLPRALTIY